MPSATQNSSTSCSAVPSGNSTQMHTDASKEKPFVPVEDEMIKMILDATEGRLAWREDLNCWISVMKSLFMSHGIVSSSYADAATGFPLFVLNKGLTQTQELRIAARLPLHVFPFNSELPNAKKIDSLRRSVGHPKRINDFLSRFYQAVSLAYIGPLHWLRVYHERYISPLLHSNKLSLSQLRVQAMAGPPWQLENLTSDQLFNVMRACVLYFRDPTFKKSFDSRWVTDRAGLTRDFETQARFISYLELLYDLETFSNMPIGTKQAR